MRPIRNHVYCNDCKRKKMLFETDKQAENFLLYNQDAILEENGRAPVRYYYCLLCGGWHLTSNPNEDVFRNTLAEKVYSSVDVYMAAKEILLQVPPAFSKKDYSECKRLIDLGLFEVDKFIREVGVYGPKILSVKKKFESHKSTLYQLQMEDAFLNIFAQKKALLITAYRDNDYEQCSELMDLMHLEIELALNNGLPDKKASRHLKVLEMYTNNIQKKEEQMLRNEMDQTCNKSPQMPNDIELSISDTILRTERILLLYSLKDRLRDIEDQFEKQNYIRCEDLLDIGYMDLDDADEQGVDPELSAIRQKFDQLQNILENRIRN